MKHLKHFALSLLIAVSALACVSTPAPHAQHIGSGNVVLGAPVANRGGLPPPQHAIMGLIQYTATHRSAAMTDLNTALGSTGFLMFLTGSQPASVATVDGGTELVDMPMSSTAGTVSAGVLTFNAITSTAAVGTGTAAHWLMCSTSSVANCVAVSSTTRVAQGAAGVSGSDINFSGGVSFTSGETIAITSLTITANGG